MCIGCVYVYDLDSKTITDLHSATTKKSGIQI